MVTKRRIVEDAFGELALAGYVFDLDPAETQAAMRRLDAMMASWDEQGIRLGYAQGLPSEGDLDDEAGIPAHAIEPVTANLAVRIAAGYGKTLSLPTLTAARDGLNRLRNAAAMPRSRQIPDLPRGAGAKQWDRPFLPPASRDPLDVSADGNLDFLGN